MSENEKNLPESVDEEKDSKDPLDNVDPDEEYYDDPIIVEMVDEDGNKSYYEEEMIIPIGEEQFALLIGIEPPHEHHDHEHHHHHHHHHDHDCEHCEHHHEHHHDNEEDEHEHEHHHEHDHAEEDDVEVLIAKIKITDDGNEEYIEPTDEEFEAVLARYEEIMSEESEEDK